MRSATSFVAASTVGCVRAAQPLVASSRLAPLLQEAGLDCSDLPARRSAATRSRLTPLLPKAARCLSRYLIAACCCFLRERRKPRSRHRERRRIRRPFALSRRTRHEIGGIARRCFGRRLVVSGAAARGLIAACAAPTGSNNADGQHRAALGRSGASRDRAVAKADADADAVTGTDAPDKRVDALVIALMFSPVAPWPARSVPGSRACDVGNQHRESDRRLAVYAAPAGAITAPPHPSAPLSTPSDASATALLATGHCGAVHQAERFR